jgi:hypothetical protein
MVCHQDRGGDKEQLLMARELIHRLDVAQESWLPSEVEAAERS